MTDGDTCPRCGRETVNYHDQGLGALANCPRCGWTDYLAGGVPSE